jgi:hypothetical protein
MKKLFLLTFLVSAAIVQSQTIDEAFISGKWKAKKAVAIKDKDKPETKELLDGFQKATYVFNADHSFVFETNSQSKMMVQLETMFNNKNKWVFDAKKKEIKVGRKSEGYSTVAFKVRIENKKVIFLIEDAGIEMVMKKQ